MCNEISKTCYIKQGHVVLPNLCYGDGDKDLKKYSGGHSFSAMKKFVEDMLKEDADLVNSTGTPVEQVVV